MQSKETNGDLVEPRQAKIPNNVSLEGRFVRIRSIDFSRDIPELFDNLCGPDRDHIWKYNIFLTKPFGSFKELGDFLNTCKINDKSEILVIKDKNCGKLVGLACYRCINTKDRTIEAGYMTLSPELQRSSASTEANYLMARHVFDDLGYRRYQWMCDSNNMPSRRAAERMGFTLEGTFRQHLILKGHNRDTMFYSIIDKEWPKRKIAFESWLSPDNFDDQGVQKWSLIKLMDTNYLTAPGDYELGPIVEGGLALELSKTMRLEGRVVLIEPLNIDLHIQQLFEELCGPESDQIWLNLCSVPFKTIEEFRNYLDEGLKQDSNVMYSIKDKISDRVVGLCGYRNANKNNRVIMLGFVNISPRLKRSTGSTEAMFLLMRHAFEDLNYRRIEWGTDTQNMVSRKAALRLGFTLEAILRHYCIFMGFNRDSALYSMIDKEWPQRKRTFESWLSIDNFDANGVQKQSLSDIMESSLLENRK